jgi:thioesterase domain-containing protein/acyl carrier protein
MAISQVQEGEAGGTSASGPNLLCRADLGLGTPWAEPQTEQELKLAEIWRNVFGMDSVGTADDFFELGGDSFAATALAAEIEATFHVCFAPADIINLSTVAKQARAVATDPSPHTPQLPPCIIVGRAGGSRVPLFVVHGARGFSFFKHAFLDEVGQDRPIYLFQAPGLDGRTKPLKTIEDVARTYVASMRELQPAGPYNVAAMCAGSFIALEMCNQLVEAGQPIARFILLDPEPTPRALAGLYPTRNTSKQPTLREKGAYWRIYDASRRMIGLGRRAPDPFEKDLRKSAKRLQQLEEAIVRRRAGQVDSAAIEERSYSHEMMLDGAQQLHQALRAHVPRPYGGQATMLISSNRADRIIGSTSFWRDHLGAMHYQITNWGHRLIFGAQIAETARFVKGVLESPG